MSHARPTLHGESCLCERFGDAMVEVGRESMSAQFKPHSDARPDHRQSYLHCYNARGQAYAG